jgi:hypothetical protein
MGVFRVVIKREKLAKERSEGFEQYIIAFILRSFGLQRFIEKYNDYGTICHWHGYNS